MAISRSELVAKYKQAQVKIKELENKEYNYKIKRACDPFGNISQMSIENVVRAGASIHDQEKTINEVIKLFGVTEADLSTEKRKFLGYSTEEWDHDFKLRIQEIHDEQELEKYQKVVELLSKNFSEDDKFDMDMAAISEIGVNLD